MANKSCSYTFRGPDGENVVLRGMPAIKAFLASGGLEYLRGQDVRRSAARDLDGFRNELMGKVQTNVAMAKMRAAAHEWVFNVGDKLLSTQTGKVYTLTGRTFQRVGPLKNNDWQPVYSYSTGNPPPASATREERDAWDKDYEQGTFPEKNILESKTLKSLTTPIVRRSTERPWYSQLERAIEGVPARLDNQSAAQWAQWLKANVSKLGVKQDEITWSGIEDYLKLAGKTKLSKADIGEYLRSNGVRVDEVTMGGPRPELTGRKRLAFEYDQAIDRAQAADAALNPEYIRGLAPADRKPEEQALLEAYDRVQEDPYEDSLYDGRAETKYGQYTLPGGENYREVLLTLPDAADEAGRRHNLFLLSMREKYGTQSTLQAQRQMTDEEKSEARRLAARKQSAPNYRSSHWDQPNILAHIRLNDRTDADGRRVLFVEELQSDWGADSRKKGIAPADWEAPYKEWERGLRERAKSFYINAAEGEEERAAAIRMGEKLAARDDLGSIATVMSERPQMAEAWAKAVALRDGVPSAPFIDDTSKWLSLGLKRVIKIAADEGYDAVAFVNGEQSADRYDLSKQVSRVAIIQSLNAKTGKPVNAGMLVAYDLSGKETLSKYLNSDSDVEELVGKEVASKLLSSRPVDTKEIVGATRRRELKGLDLSVGGEGMKAFYDQIVPQVARDLVKKMGGQGLTTVSLPGADATPLESYRIGDDGDGGYAVFWRATGEKVSTGHATKAEAKTEMRRHADSDPTTQTAFAITDAMREKAATGMPLFSRERGWDGFPDAVIAAPLAAQSKDPSYEAAKAGNTAAARKLVQSVLQDDAVAKVRAMIGDTKPVIVPVSAEEAAGRNKIPLATADELGSQLGLGVDVDIVQSTRSRRSGRDGMGRLANQPDFIGEVAAGQDYLIVDDTLTQGGTLAQLKTYIEANGGRVVGAFALGGKQYSAKMALDPENLSKVRDAYGAIEDWWRDTLGFGFAGLTESEARYILNTKLSPDALRDRVAAARDEGRLGEAAPGQGQEELSGEPGSGDIRQSPRRGEPPKKTVKAFKLFRVDERKPGQLFPLFVDANTPVPMGKWVDADIGPAAPGGKVKSKLGPLAFRPGWHAGDLPIATHIGAKSSPDIAKPDLRPDSQVWAEVELAADRDWQVEADKRGTNAAGKIVAVKAHITDQVPTDGFYRYKTNPNMTGNWLISGSMKVSRILSDKEVAKINSAAGAADLPREQPLDLKRFGFDARKSAERGSFDDNDPNILSSAERAWQTPGASKFDDVVYKLQDKQVDLKRIVEAVKDARGEIRNDLDTYLQEELFHGRAAKRTEDFVNKELQPLVDEMAKRGLTIEELDEYLHARHAKEANELVAERNPDSPDLQDGGSGMKTKAAQDHLASLAADKREHLMAAAAKVDAILAKTRKLVSDYELESRDTVNGWNSMFDHYVPLMREDDGDAPQRLGTGQGFSIKGREVRSRTGSTRKVVDILANIAMQRERTIVRGEKNRVAQSLIGLAQANPNKDFWTVDLTPTTPTYDPKKGVVVMRPDPMFKSRPNVVVAKVREEDGSVKEHAVSFSERDARAMRTATALKNLDAAQLEGLMGASAGITRYFAAVNTQYNPVFGVVNLVRDVQGALINLQATELAGKQKDVAKNTLSALRGIYADARAARRGGSATSAWAGLWEDFQDVGGQTGFRQLFATSNDRADAIQKALSPDAWMDSKLGKIFTANGTLRVPLAVAMKGARWIFDWLSDYNLAMENGIRLATYKAGLDAGMSRERAASLAKNLTVNFNRKGQIGQQAGAVYAFFNASMQGTARLGQVIFDMEPGKPKTIRLSGLGKKVVYGGLTLGAMQALALAAAGFSDDDPPDFVRERALVIPTGGKTYVSIPMPLGFHLIPSIGRMTTEWAMGGFKDTPQRAVKMLGMFADTFNPIGNAGLSMQTLAPTALDPLVALTENKDWQGRPIAKESYNKATPGTALSRDTDTSWARLIAETVNAATGGNEYVAGAISPVPSQIDYLIGQITGGVGREFSKVEQATKSVVTGEELPLYKIPLVGRFAGNSASQASEGNAFYANTERLNRLETEIKGLQKDGKMAEASALRAARPDAYLMAQANLAERQIAKLRKQKSELVKDGAPREQVRSIEEQITARMAALNRAAEALKAREPI